MLIQKSEGKGGYLWERRGDDLLYVYICDAKPHFNSSRGDLTPATPASQIRNMYVRSSRRLIFVKYTCARNPKKKSHLESQ